MAMRFCFFDPADPPRAAVSVDGVMPGGLNLSHWPGNRTPPQLKHDLSTGIVLRLLELPAAERDRLLAGVDTVTNNHIDSDGILAVAALLDPALALARRERFLAIARTGDFQVFTDAAALAIELSLTALTDTAGATGSFASEPARRQHQYAVALRELPRLLDDPWCHVERIAAELAQVTADLAALTAAEVTITHHTDLSLAIVDSPRPLHRIAVNTAAADCLRVLHVIRLARGHLYRLHERVESWFDLATLRPPPRQPLGALAERLEALEAPESDPHWVAMPQDCPVPECYFGIPGIGRGFGPFAPGDLCVSRLRRRLVTAAVLDHYERQRPAGAATGSPTPLPGEENQPID